MLNAYNAVLTLHIVAGIIGLAAFWTPAIARKGGAVHVRAGRIFFYATCGVALSGVGMAALLLADPVAIKAGAQALTPERAEALAAGYRTFVPFLLYLVLITFVPVHHGVRVLQTRGAPERLRTPFHTTINLIAMGMSIVLIGVGIWARQPVFIGLSPIGLLAGWGHLAFARRPYPTPMAWWYEHMGGMLGGGIAFHTAFFVLGAGRLLGIEMAGTSALVPWLLPTIVGIPAGTIWVRYYRRKFKEDVAVTSGHEVPTFDVQLPR